MAFLQFLYYFFGLDNGSGSHYLFFSGVGSDITELAIVSAAATFIVGWWHKHNCVVQGCWRIGKFPVPRTAHVTCRHHHPEGGAPSHEDVIQDYLRNL
jgi:hypothetical protein